MRLPWGIGGPRLGVKLALLGVPLALFVPWVSYLSLAEMERVSVQMQSNQQRLIAESIAVNFNGRDDLFADLPVAADSLTLPSVLEARPIQGPTRPRLNGSVADWDAQAVRPVWFGRDGEDGAFTLSLGTRSDVLYAFLEVVDDVRVYRNPEVLRLDNADQIRIGFLEPNGEDGRIAVTLSETGSTTAYRMDADWRYANVGPPESSVQGFVAETERGYAVEMSMPFALFGSRNYFGFSFVDVDDPQSAEIRAIVHTGDSNLAVYRDPELLKTLEGLGFSDMRILMVDTEQRIRADVGSYRTGESPSTSWQSRVLDGLSALPNTLRRWFIDADDAAASDVADRVVATALAGQPIALRRQTADVETIMAGHPIASTQGETIGVVAVEQNINDVLAFQRDAFDRIALVTVASFFIVPLCLVAFAGRLTWRIRHLQREATSAIDEHGRLQSGALASGTTSGDEIGDLARSISNMLARLDQHDTFLKKMPRTLRHEINNPLNALNTSLEHLGSGDIEPKEDGRDKYLQSARRGVLRIGAIVQNLADAANLEESLAAEEAEVVDIQALIESYVSNCRSVHQGHRFDFRGWPGPVLAEVADFRIEQMLDKLIDNAIDFHRANSAIRVQLDVTGDMLRIVVANRGPTLPAGGSLFESMVSRREPTSNLHFGLGLYVVRVIAEQHGGAADAVNLADESGVAFVVWLPLAGTNRLESA